MSTEPVKEPVLTHEPDGKGRPAFTDEQYWRWLEDMRPFLEMGNSIYYACCKAGIDSHYFVIREKYKAGGPFSNKIDSLRALPGEMTNNTLVKLVKRISDKVNNDMGISAEDFNVLKLMAEKHRTAQPFFVTRQENADADPSKVGKVLDTLEGTDYDELGQQASKQMVAPHTPVQNQEQAGTTGDVPAQPDAAAAPSGT